ncbi:hypothetical protein B0T20DRAFT_443823 [Sordaria brevicollis]|uniref:Uncharacterized protein n=1 Tax=Sordaria brevicollis TaxID=83679 RepID=A0AAE0U9E2_SORBR|nr:hypothetical protein B0T20DRAFT_443823 [Sordaria brevicollis]
MEFVEEPEPTSAVQQIESTTPVDIDIDDTLTLPPTPEAHSYHHAAPVMEILEVNISSAAPIHVTESGIDDLGASASSVDYNSFERFLDEDRMWGIHRPALRKPSIRPFKATEKPEIVVLPSVKADEKVAKEVPTYVSAGANNICTSLGDDITHHHGRNLSIESTESHQTANSDASTETDLTTPDTASSSPDGTHKPEPATQPPTIPLIVITEHIEVDPETTPASPVIPSIIITEPTEDSPDASDNAAPIIEGEGELPTAVSLPLFEHLYDYASLNFSAEDMANLWVTQTVVQPGNPHEYARLNDGFWYIVEDGENMRMMVEEEYNQFVHWVMGMQENQLQVVQPVYNTTPEESEGLVIQEDQTEQHLDVAEDDEKDWAELLGWKSRTELGRDWEVLKSFAHPEHPDSKYAFGTDDKWYFEYEGMFRQLMEDELDLLHCRMEDNSALADANAQKATTNRWGLETITEEEEEC